MNAPSTTLLDEALAAWRYARESFIDEAENIDADEYDFRPTDENRTVAELIRHDIENGLMAAGELTRPDGDFSRQGYPEFLDEYAGHVAEVEGKDALLDLLRSSYEDGERRIREAGEIFMLQAIVQFSGEPATRLAWLHHAIAHEDYHRGQLALYARLLGKVPALTQRIMGG